MKRKNTLITVFVFSYLIIAQTIAHAVSHEENVLAILNSVNPTMHMGICVVSLDDNAIVYQKNADQLFTPASTLKTVTALAALYYLKPDFTFKTELATDGSIQNNTLQGNLYIKGDGDPALSIENLESLIISLKNHGIQTITGNLCLDNTCFDSMQFGPGCAWDDGVEFWNAPVDGLNIQHNVVSITVSPQHNNQISYQISPELAYNFITIKNNATCDNQAIEATTSTISIDRSWQTRENSITIDGHMTPSSKPYKKSVTIENPALYAGYLFKNLLKRHNITLSGSLVFQKSPIESRTLALHTSATLSQLLDQVLAISDNLYSDAIFKKIGAVFTQKTGSFPHGIKAVKNFLVQELGFDKDECVIVDGSGLSRYNLISPNHMIRLLLWIAQSPYFDVFLKASAVSGLKGTLATRLLERPGTIMAKSGTMSGISGLTGFFETLNGKFYAFSFFLNGFVQPSNQKTQTLKIQSSLNYDPKVLLEDELCYYFARN